MKMAIEKVGGFRAMGRLLGLSHEAPRKWKKIPDKYLLKIEKLTGIDREQLRPDLFRR